MLRSLAQHAEDAGVGRKTIPASCTGAMCCERTPFACQPPLQRRIRSVRAPAARRLAAAAAHHLSADTQCGRLRGPCCWYCTVPVHRPLCCGPLRSCILRAGLGMRRPASHHARPAWWSGGGRGKRAKKGTYIGSVHPRVILPLPRLVRKAEAPEAPFAKPAQNNTPGTLVVFGRPWSASRCWYVATSHA